MPQQLRAGARDPPDAVQRMGHKPFDMVTEQLTPQDAVTVPPTVPGLGILMCWHSGYSELGSPSTSSLPHGPWT